MASRTCRSSQTSIVPLRSLSKARKASRQPAWCVCDFWRETSSRRVTLRVCLGRERTSGATRRRRAAVGTLYRPGRALSLGARGTGCRPVWHMAAPFLTRDGGGELKTLEPCHRSRPGTAPSYRRRSPFASDAAAGHDGQRCTIIAWEPDARFQRSGYRVRGRRRFVARESICENSRLVCLSRSTQASNIKAPTSHMDLHGLL